MPFNQGDGQDTIEDNGSASNDDRIVIHDYEPSETQLARSGNDLIISFDGTTDQITVVNSYAVKASLSADAIEEIVFDDATVWDADFIRETLLDQASTDGDDVIDGFLEADVLEGGLGDDELHGDKGDDDYVFTRGDGQDTIEDNGSALDDDRIVIHGYEPSEAQLARAGNDLIISFTGTTDQITVVNSYAVKASLSTDAIGEVVFDDATVWDADFIRQTLLDQAASDGDDVITGFLDPDVLEGGLGDDTLHGDNGSDTDRLVLHDYTPGEVQLAKDGGNPDNLIVSFTGTSDQVTVINMFSPSSSYADAIEEIVFDDGTVWDSADIDARANPPEIGELDGDGFTYTLADGAAVIDQAVAVTVTDADSADFDGGRLTVSLGATAQTSDVLSIRDEGTAAGEIGFDGTTVTFGGTVIGTRNVISTDATLVIDLNASAKPGAGEAAEALLRNVTFENASGDPTAAVRTASFTLEDGDEGISATAEVTITVTNAPVANGDAASADENGNAVAIDVLGNDVDIDPDDDASSLRVATASAASGAALSFSGLAGAGISYDPDGVAAFEGLALGETTTDDISYTIKDSHDVLSNSGTVTVTVTGTNDAPVASAAAVAAAEDGAVVSAGFAGSDVDSDDSQATLTYALTSAPAEGGVVIDGGGTSFSFDPGSDFQDLGLGETRDVSFDFTATDSHQAVSNTGTVTVTVTGVNDGPTDIGLSNETAAEDLAVGSTIGVLSATDPDAGDTASFSIVADADAKFTIVGDELRLDGALDFETDASHAVTDRITDGAGLFHDEAFVITVTDVNEAPTVALANTTVVLAEDADTSAALKVADIVVTDDPVGTNDLTLAGADAGLFEIVGSELFLKAATVLDFETNPSLDVTIEVDDAGVGGFPDDTALLSISVTDAGETPTLNDDSVTTNIVDGATVIIPITALLGNDDDAPGGVPGDFAITAAVGGTAAVVGDDVVFTPDASPLVSGSFDYVFGGLAAEDAATVDITGVDDIGVSGGSTGDILIADGGVTILSVNASASVTGNSTFQDEDLFGWNGSGFEPWFDGSDHELGGDSGRDINAADVLANGDIVFSITGGNETFGGVNFEEEDLILWDGAGYSMFFEGDPNGLDGGYEDIDAVHVVDAASGSFIFSTSGGGSAGGISWSDEDLVLFDGSAFSKFWDGGDNGYGGDIDAVDVLANGAFVFSTLSPVTLDGTSFDDSDLILWDGAGFSMAFDGSDPDGTGTLDGLSTSYEDTDAAAFGVGATLDGDAGDDVLIGGSGNDTITGGAGDDLIVYRDGGGADTITDFTTGAGSDDVIELYGVSGITGFADVQAAASQIGADTLIDFGGTDLIVLAGVDVNTLHADDFLI